MSSRRIASDESARVPFAMVAVLILMMSVFSMTYIGGVQRQQAGLRIAGLEISRHNSIMHQVEDRMALEGFYLASKAVVASTQFFCNETMLDSCYTENYSAYLNSTFPLFIDPYRIEIRDFTSAVFLEERGLKDLVPSNRTEKKNITLKNEDGQEYNGTVDVMDAAAMGELNETSALATYIVVGSGNCTVINTLNGRAMERPIAFQRDMDTPFPLMNSKAKAIEAAGTSNTMGIARVVKYILTTVAQFRVLQGYGSGLGAAPGDISEIISVEDVNLAVNMAVLLETSREFRAYDRAVLEAMDSQGLGAAGTSLVSLLDEYMSNTTLDSADIIAIYTGIGDMTIPVDLILAQAFNAIADQFLLKYLDYFGIMDIANEVYKGLQSLKVVIDDAKKTISQFLFSDEGENRDDASQVTGWIAKLDTQWPPVSAPLGMSLSKEQCARTDLAVLDVHQPINELFHYNANCSQLLSENSEPVRDSDGTVIGTIYHASLRSSNISASTNPSASSPYQSGYLADFAPVNMMRQSDALINLWADFHEQHYSSQQDEIYDSVRDAVKNVTAELARLITSFIGQGSISLSGYMGGKYAIDPNDSVSVLENIHYMMDSVIDDAVAHIQDNPGLVGTMLSVLTSTQSQLAMHFMEFLALNYDTIVNRQGCVDDAVASLSISIMGNASIVSSSPIQYSADYTIYNSIGHARGYSDDPLPYDCTSSPDKVTQVRMLLEQNGPALETDMLPHAEAAYQKLKDAESRWQYFGSPGNGLYIKALEKTVQQSSSRIFNLFVGDDPSALVGLAADMVRHVLDGIIWSGEVSNTRYFPEMAYADDSGRMDFEIEGSGPAQSDKVWREQFDVSLPLGPINVFETTGTVNAMPGILALNISTPSGVHFTDVATFNERPFENRWNLTLRGTVPLIISSSSLPYLVNGTHIPAEVATTIEFDLDIPILAYSGWDLAGVNYTSTASLAGDVEKLLDVVGAFFDWVWETIAGPIDWIIDQIMMVVDFFSDILGTLMSYASDIMQIITEIIGSLVEAVQDFIREVAQKVFDSILDWILDLIPDELEFRFSMFGFDFKVRFANMDELDNVSAGLGGSLFTLETEGDLFGAGMLLGIEFLALPDDVAETAEIDYDLLLWNTMDMNGFILDTRIDPFKVFQDHIVEISGQGNGMGLEIKAPVLMQTYDSVRYSLHDIPGVGAALSNIPVPIPGMKATVNAGLEILYTLRGIESDHPVINEIELNPEGETRGNQWVEIYNPTDFEVCMGNWSLGSPTHPEFNRTFNSTIFIEPGGYWMEHYFNSTLPRESVKLELLDATGRKIDSTPTLSEQDNSVVEGKTIGSMGCGMTWQRSPNGANLSMAGKWTFANSSIGAENAAINISFKALVMNLLKGAWNTTWQDLKDEIELSLDFIVRLVKQFIQRFIEDVLKVVQRSVVETSLFLDIMLKDASGTGGGGIKLSFVIEGGDTLTAILRWIIGSVATYLANLGKPNIPGQYPKLAPEVPEHLFVRLDFYAMVKIPKMVKSASQSGEEPESIKMIGRIEANIPALAALAGREMGRWRINFGVYIEKMPAEIADALFGTGDATPDVWVFKGAVWEM
jgi:hypothetical protein